MQSLIIKILVFLSAVFLLSISVFSQNLYKLEGIVVDEFNHPLVGSSILLDHEKKGTTSNKNGVFLLSGLAKKKYLVKISFLGYQTISDTILLNGNFTKVFSLTPLSNQLNELTVTNNQSYLRKTESSMALEVVDKDFLNANVSGSLMQTLSRLPGISSMDIGAGQSKPVIRGLGFTRVVVAENGVKHEAQEWGADHGLEIDQFTIDQLDIIKGPASLMYGANAIGGVIDMKQIKAPQIQTQGGGLLLNTQTNNSLYGASVKLFKRFNTFYFKTHFTYTDYADYRVPTDSISYMNYNIYLKDNKLRNSAGLDRNGGFTLGYLNNNFSSHLGITNNFSKSGFFANAHGLEIRTSSINYDCSDRDIDLPSQQVNHFKILSNTRWMIQDYRLNIDLGFQNNLRKEFSEKVSHGYMPVPPDSLERLYNKTTWTGNAKIEFPIHNMHRFTAGLNTDYQKNSIDGWGFMLPEFQSVTGGVFAFDNIHISESLMVNAGARYDVGSIYTHAHSDWYITPQPGGTGIYSRRANDLKRTYGNLSWGVGVVHKGGLFTLKANLGNSFRMPTAKELVSNGINYHMYRFEKGDTTLRAEESYQLDFGLMFKKGKWYAELTPFVNYFPNYIYLNPTSGYFEAQQIYYYSQSKVFRSGGEVLVGYDISDKIKISVDAEYIYSLQLSGSKKGYTLPFSPPLTANIELSYHSDKKWIFGKPNLGIDFKLVATQNEIVPPEKKTTGYMLVNLNAGAVINVNKRLLELNIRLHNAMNTGYHDHTSFYRLIEVPGQGRNLVISLQTTF